MDAERRDATATHRPGRIRRARLRAVAAAFVGLSVVGPGGAAAQQVVDLPGRDRPLEPRLVPVYEVGLDHAAEWQAFRELSGASFADDGTLYLLDGAGRSVVAVAPDGSLLHRVGGAGEGPGEYTSPNGVVALPDGGVAVWDARKRAFLIFDADGAVGREVRPSYGVGLPDGPFAVVPDPRGVSLVSLPAVIVAGRLGRAYLTGDGFERAEGSLPLLRTLLRDGAPVEAMARVRVPVETGPPPWPVVRPFDPVPSWGLLSGGRLAVHDETGYRVRVIDPDGTVRRVLERPIEPRTTRGADREAYRRALEEGVRRVIGQPGAPSKPGDGPEPYFAPVLPAIRRIVTDRADRIWVERRDPDDAMAPGPVDLLDPQGRYLGTVREGLRGVPDAFGPEGLAVYLGTGPLDVPVARVYRITGAPGG